VGHVTCTKILSTKAKSIISEEHIAGRYDDRKDSHEPPFMAPSEDPDDYSIVRFLAFLARIPG
jgi:hypothetical protein